MKPSMAVHKFSSCDGCQLALLTAGEALLQLADLVEIKHFAEAGYIDEAAQVDIAFVEGSISTPAEEARIQTVRNHSNYLVTIGACATAGGIQALRNGNDLTGWKTQIYPKPEFIHSLANSTAIKNHVKVDDEIWGCPISTSQIFAVIRQLLFGVTAPQKNFSVCMECKQKNHRCVLVTEGAACLGPVTRAGCGALCPSVGASCYGCYGPAEQVNGPAIADSFKKSGFAEPEILQRFQFITNQSPQFQQAVSDIQTQGKSHAKTKKNP